MEFVKIFRYFAQILRDFARLFTKSKLLGVRLHSLLPRLLHHCINILKQEIIFLKKRGTLMEPLKLMEPRYVFYGTLGFRGTPVEEH